MNFARTFLKYGYDLYHLRLLVMKYCMNLVYIYFLRAKTTWESSETLPLPVAGEVLPWKRSRFGPECAHVPLFTVLIVLFLSLVEGREYLFFLVTRWILSCFVYCSFQCLFYFNFLSFQYSHMSFAVPVLEMFLDVLYFHSCGIVGIMMVMIKLAHLFAVYVCLNVSCGLIWHSEEKTDEGPITCVNAVVSIHWTPWMFVQTKKQRSFNNTACNWALMSLQYVKICPQ